MIVIRVPRPALRPFVRLLWILTRSAVAGVIRDPFGHRWSIGHRIEEVSPEEMQRRYDTLLNA